MHDEFPRRVTEVVFLSVSITLSQVNETMNYLDNGFNLPVVF